MSYTTRVFVVAAVLVLLALASCGSAFDLESLLHTAEQRAAYREAKRLSSSTDADTCDKIMCDINAGNDTCFLQENSTIHVCQGFNFCNASNVCEAKFPVGHECSSSGECATGYFTQVTCQFNVTSDIYTCTPVKVPSWPGESCAEDSDCFSQHCNNGTCEGNREEEECWGNLGACAKGLYCNGTVCLNATADNGNCSHSDECAFLWTGRECLAGRCVAPFSVQEGASCDPSLHTSFAQCAGGLYCDPYSSTCKKFERIECEVGNDTQCEALPQTTCRCSPLTGAGVCANDNMAQHLSVDGVKYFKAALQCALDNSCPLDPNNKCFMSHCMADTECFASELFKNIEMDLACFGFKFECNPENPSESNPSDDASAVSTTAAVVISALAAVAALL